MWGARGDQPHTFIRRGYWFLGWSDADAPDQAFRHDQIRAGDRIAIQRMMGRDPDQIRITALGIVTEVDEEDNRVYDELLANDLDRPGERERGLFQADPWAIRCR